MRSDLDVRSWPLQTCVAGHVRVLRCHPLRAGGEAQPFPTLFWLACPELARQVAELERRGVIRRLEHRIMTDLELRRRVADDHDDYIEERTALMSDGERQLVERRGMMHALTKRGIGGIRDWSRVKCLHLHYAHYLARGSAVGELIEQYRLELVDPRPPSQLCPLAPSSDL